MPLVFVIELKKSIESSNMYNTHLGMMYQVKEIYYKVKMSKDTLQYKLAFKKRC